MDICFCPFICCFLNSFYLCIFCSFLVGNFCYVLVDNFCSVYFWLVFFKLFISSLFISCLLLLHIYFWLFISCLFLLIVFSFFIFVVTSVKTVTFSSVLVRLVVRRVTWKVINRFSLNLAGRLGMIKGRTHFILVLIWIWLFFTFSNIAR